MAQYDPALKETVYVFQPCSRDMGHGKTKMYERLRWNLVHFDNDPVDLYYVEPIETYVQTCHASMTSASPGGGCSRGDQRKEKVTRFEFLDQLPARVRFD